MGLESIFSNIQPLNIAGPLDNFKTAATLQALIDDKRLKQMQLSNIAQKLPLELEELRLKNEKTKRLSDIINAAFSDQQPQAVAGQGMPSGISDQEPEFQRKLKQAQALGIADPARGRMMMEALKLEFPDLKEHQGLLYKGRTGNVVSSMPFGTAAGDVIQYQGNPREGFRVTVPQGANEALRQGQLIREQAKADFDPFLGQVDEQNRPIPQTRGQFARGISGMPQSTPQSQQPQGQSQPGVQRGMGMTPFALSYDKERAQLAPKWEEKVGADAAMAATSLTKLRDAEQALQNFEPGKLTPLKKSIGEWLVSTGVMSQKDADEKFGGIADMQKFTSVMTELVATSVRQADAQPALRQIEMMEKAYPQLVQTGRAAQLLLQTLIRDRSLPLMKAETYANFLENGGQPQDYQKFESWFNTKFAPSFRPDIVKNFGIESQRPGISGLPNPPTTRRAPRGFQPGQVIDGYRFKGGDEYDRNNYERVR